METKTKAKRILTVLHVLAWIVFFGLCVKTGAILISFFISLAANAEAAKNLHLGLNLYDLKRFSLWHYSTMVLFVASLTALQAYMFYQVIRIFLKINLVLPFSTDVATLITRISYIALACAI